MISTSSSATTNGCDNISSNCVIWQGPDIACIDLCNGDTISEVTKKIGDKVCQIITDGVSANPNLTGLDLSCLNIQGTTPTTLVPVLQAMVNQICLNASSSGGGGTTPLPMMVLPACLRYNDASGNPVTELRLDAFATLIANQVCTNLASINTINTTLTSFNTRIDVLEACVLPCSGGVVEAQIIPTCVSNIGNLTNVSVVVLALETAFCSLQTAVGLPSAINLAINQSVITGTSNSLTNSSVSYGSISGWNNSASTLAQSVQNAWVVIDDLYSAVAAIQTNCCPGGCDAIVYNYTTSNSFASNGLINGVLFNFIGSSIPSTFSDASGYTLLTLTDVTGTSLSTTVSVSSLQNNASGYLFSTGALNTAQDINVTVNYSFIDGTDTCSNNQSSVITGVVPCQIPVTSAITQTDVTVGFSNLLGTTAVYTIDIIDGASVIVATDQVTNPGTTVTRTLTGLTPNTAYTVRLTVQFNGATQVCNSTQQTFTTESAAASCSDGMDVAFIMDYSGSMAASIAALQSGFAALISTISTSSGANNYRLSIVTADEDNTSTTPRYGSCTEYTSLPATQRLNYPGNDNHQLFITAWEMFQDNNATTATTALNQLGQPPLGTTCVQMGSGGNTGPECTDQAINRVLNNSFTNAWRSNVAKYIIVGTDVLPGGDDGAFDANDWTFIQTLATQALTQGVQIFILGPGVDFTYTPPGQSPVFPWRYLATQTNGAFNNTFDTSVINTQITASCLTP